MEKVARNADFITRWCLILIAFLTPLFVIPVQWTTIPQAKILLVGTLVLIALISWLFARLAEGKVELPKHILLIGGALLPVVYAVSALAADNVWSSLVSGNVASDTAAIIGIWYVLFFLTAYVFSNRSASINTLLRVILAGLCGLVIFQFLRLLFPDLLSLGGYLSGNASSILGLWHDLGIFLGLGVFFALAFFDTPVASGWWRSILVVTGALSFLTLIVINSADVWYALASLTLAYGLWQLLVLMREGLGFIQSLSSKIVMASLVLMLISFASGYWGSTYYSYLPSKLQVVQTEVRPSWQGTYMVGQKALSSPRAFILGSGPNTFNRNWGLFKPTEVNVTDYWNVDFNAGVGFIPTTFVTTGVLALLAWAIILFGLLWSAWKLLRRRVITPGHTVLGAIVGGALYLMAFQIIYLPGIVLSALMFILIGIIVALEIRDSSRAPFYVDVQAGSIIGISSAIIVIITSVFFALAAVTAMRAVVSHILVQRAASIYTSESKIEAPLSLVHKALSVFPENDLAHRAAVEIGLLQLSKLMESGKTDNAAQEQLKSELQSTISHGLTAVSIDSADYQNWLSLAVLYKNLAGVGIEGAYENARDAYQRSMAENPTNPLPHLQLAQLSLAQGKNAEAEAEITRALALKPNFGAAYYLRSQIEAADGRYPQAIEDASNATQLAPQDPVGWYNLGSILYVAGSYNLAVEALARAASLQNNYANAIFILGLSLDQVGRHEEALAAMQAVQKLNPNDETVQKIIANLEKGKPALSSANENKSGAR
jgi:tetratricopeptide (TPR) repeat protein